MEQCPLPVSEEIHTALGIYHALLLKWNKAINLVSPSTIADSWTRHFVDSAQIVQNIPNGTKTLADLGSGGGFPGLVIALMRPDIQVHLIESDERKGQFLRTVSRETAAQNVTIHTQRIEAITEDLTPDFVTARALASLPELLKLCLPWAEKNPMLAMGFMKGAQAQEEIQDAQALYDFEKEMRPSLTDPRAHILLIRNLQKRDHSTATKSPVS